MINKTSVSPGHAKRDLLLDNLHISQQFDEEKSTKILKRLSQCGQHTISNAIMCNCGIYKLTFRCGYRICEFCSKKKSWKLFAKFIDFLKTKRIARSIYGIGLRFLTLTIENTNSIEEGIEKLYCSLNNFKRNVYVKARITGGLGVIEVTKGQDGRWHVHMHLIIESKYLDMKSHKKKGGNSKLVEAWKKATDGSCIIYIDRIMSHGGALNYVLKYVSKGLKNFSEEEKLTYFKSTFKRRLIFTFGKGYYKFDFKKIKTRCKTCGCHYQFISSYSMEYHHYFESDNTYSIPHESPNLNKLLGELQNG